MRERNGETVYTMRHEVGSENLLGAGNSYAQSGGQWGAWNATFSLRGADGLPVPLWNPQSGAINHAVAEQWKKYDIRAYLEANWPTLGPKLRGKLHITVGDADNYFLNNAVHLLDAFLSKAEPKYEGSILYGPGEGHVWTNLTEAQLLAEMNAQRFGVRAARCALIPPDSLKPAFRPEAMFASGLNVGLWAYACWRSRYYDRSEKGVSSDFFTSLEEFCRNHAVEQTVVGADRDFHTRTDSDFIVFQHDRFAGRCRRWREIAASGGLIMAMNSSTPIMPRLDTLNVPP